MGFLCTAFLIFAPSSCTLNEDFINDSMDRFDDQDYKDVIGLVELYKLRSGKYPASLDVIRFEGEWDMLNQESVYNEMHRS